MLIAGFDTMDAIRNAFAMTGVKFIGNGFDRQTFLGGAIGYCAYDMVYDCWLDIIAKKAEIKSIFDEYLEFGGFPEVVLTNEKKQLLLTYFPPYIKILSSRRNPKPIFCVTY